MKNIFYFISISTFLLNASLSNAQWTRLDNMNNEKINNIKAFGDIILASSNNFGNNKIYRSSNDGVNWSQFDLPNEDNGLLDFMMRGDTLFAISHYSFYHSTNSGITWSGISYDNGGNECITSNSQYIFKGMYDHGVERSSDNGFNWTQTSFVTRDVRCLTSIGTDIYAAQNSLPEDSGGVFKTTNNGDNWSRAGLRGSGIFSLRSFGNKLLAGSFNGFFISYNGGANWNQSIINGNNVTVVAPLYSSNIFALTYNYGGVYYSSNDGSNWNNIYNNLPPNELSFQLTISNNYLFVINDNSSNFTDKVWRRPISDIVGIQAISNEIPSGYSLKQNYPNPFNPTTNIEYELPSSNFVSLKVFDINGKELETLVNQNQNAGSYSVTFNASNYPSGVYFYKLETNSFSETKKMILIK